MLCGSTPTPHHNLDCENVTSVWVIQFNLLVCDVLGFLCLFVCFVSITEERTMCNRSQHEQGFIEVYLLWFFSSSLAQNLYGCR